MSSTERCPARPLAAGPRRPARLVAAGPPTPPLRRRHAADAGRRGGRRRGRDRRRRLEKVEVIGNGDQATAEAHEHRDQDRHRAAGRAAGDHRHHQRADPRPGACRAWPTSIRYVPGAAMAQGEGNRDTPILRGSSSTADLFVDGMRDDAQYFRDLYNIERVEALKGPNAMIFGRGGSGGVLNRVSKQADWDDVREFNLTWAAGAAAARSPTSARRLSDVLRLPRDRADRGHRQLPRRRRIKPRWGINPTIALARRRQHHAHPRLRALRGRAHRRPRRALLRPGAPLRSTPIRRPSSAIRSAAAPRPTSTPATLLLEHDFGNGLNLRNRTRVAQLRQVLPERIPGRGRSPTAPRSPIRPTTTPPQRENMLQPDRPDAGRRHRRLEPHAAGRPRVRPPGKRQPAARPATSRPAIARRRPPRASPSPRSTSRSPTRATRARSTSAQCASDGDNHSVARVAAAYVQDQIEFSPQWQAIFGLRYDRFELDFHNNRNGQDLSFDRQPAVAARRPGLEAGARGLDLRQLQHRLPAALGRAAVLAEPSPTPRSIRKSTTNTEIGAKWQVTPELNLTAAVYRLDRANVAVVDPDRPDPPRAAARRQPARAGRRARPGRRHRRALARDGRLRLAEGRDHPRHQTSPTAVLPKGTELAQVPRHSFSLWNRVDLGERWGVGLGVDLPQHASTPRPATRSCCRATCAPTPRCSSTLDAEARACS